MKLVKNIFTISLLSSLLIACSGGSGGGSDNTDINKSEITQQTQKPEVSPGQKPPVNEQKPPVNEQKPPVNEQKPPVNEQKPPVNEQKPPVNEQKPPVNEQKPPVNEQKPPVNEQKPKTIEVTIYEQVEDPNTTIGHKFVAKNQKIELQGKEVISNSKDIAKADYYIVPLAGDFKNGHMGFVRKPSSNNAYLAPELKLVVENKMDTQNLANLNAKFSKDNGAMFVETDTQGASHNNTGLIHRGDVNISFVDGKVSKNKIKGGYIYGGDITTRPSGKEIQELFHIHGDVNELIFVPGKGADAYGIKQTDKSTAQPNFIAGQDGKPAAITGEFKGEGYHGVFQADKK